MEAIYTHVPGLKVVVPSTPFDAKGLLLAAIEDPDPVIFLEPIRLYRAVKEDVPDGWYTVPLGEARVETEGDRRDSDHLGGDDQGSPPGGRLLGAEGFSAEVIDLRSLVPLDEDAIVASVQKTGRAVVIHEAPRTGGFGARSPL